MFLAMIGPSWTETPPGAKSPRIWSEDDNRLINPGAMDAGDVGNVYLDGVTALLDEAHALGLSVTVGIWLGHERHGFDYADEAQVAEDVRLGRYSAADAARLFGVGDG